MASALRRDSNHDGNVCDLAAIEALRVVRTTTASTNAVLHSFEFNKVAGLAASQTLEAVVGRVLEDIERVRNIQMALHSIRFHSFSDVGRTGTVPWPTLFLVHLREAAHEGHVVYLDRVFNQFQDRLIVIGPEILAHSRCYAVQTEARVCHAQFLNEISALHPGGEIDDLLAVKVDNSETLAFLHLEGETMSGFADVCLRAGRGIPHADRIPRWRWRREARDVRAGRQRRALSFQPRGWPQDVAAGNGRVPEIPQTPDLVA